MKTDLSHLPESKRRELAKIAIEIRKPCADAEMIILFGSYARGDYNEEKDLKPNRRTGHKSDYDILVVTGEKITAQNIGLWKSVAEKCDALRLSAHVRIIANDIQELNIKLAEGQYFYSDIKKEGRVLYDSGKYRLANKRRLTSAEKQRIAQDHFNHWFERAKRFFRHTQLDIEEHDYKGAAFQLHQSAEAAYKTIHLVFKNYNPNEHYLAALKIGVDKFDPGLKSVFPKRTSKDYKLFEKLDAAYIGARYEPEYQITKEELVSLAGRVERLLDITKRICARKISISKPRNLEKGKKV